MFLSVFHWWPSVAKNRACLTDGLSGIQIFSHVFGVFFQFKGWRPLCCNRPGEEDFAAVL
jgi:hypothetical protein